MGLYLKKRKRKREKDIISPGLAFLGTDVFLVSLLRKYGFKIV
jgi:hypothetical protein